VLAALSPCAGAGLGAAGSGALLLGALGVSFHCTVDALLEDIAVTAPLLLILQNSAVSVSHAAADKERAAYAVCARAAADAGWARLRPYSVMQGSVSCPESDPAPSTADAYVSNLLDAVQGKPGAKAAAANVPLDKHFQALLERNTSVEFAAQQPLGAVAWF
jgi:hypothetical protein